MKKGQFTVGDDVRRLKTSESSVRSLNGARDVPARSMSHQVAVPKKLPGLLASWLLRAGTSRAPFNLSFLALLFLALTVRAATNEFTDMMQKALFEEEANHNLPAAIEGYQNIITRFDDSRGLAATAIFRLAECYRKQGKTNEAAAQYQRIVRDFSDQNSLAALSQQNLGVFGMGEVARQGNAAPGETVESAEVKRLEAMFTESPDLINARDSAGATPLHRAAEKGQLPLVEFLLAHGADIDARETGQREPAVNGRTPLAYAVQAGHKSVVELLLKKGANVKATDSWRWTPLHIAAERGFRAIAQVLLAHGADVNANRNNGFTPLHLAVVSGNQGVVELLLASHPDVNATAYVSHVSFGEETFGGTPLHVAVKVASAALVTLLLDSKATVDVLDDSGKTPLSRAASSGKTNLVSLLLDHGADPNFKCPKGAPPGWTPLHDAIGERQKDSVAMLLAHGADPNARVGSFLWASGQYNDYTPLLMATRLANRDIVETLLKFKADPNAKSATRDTPLLNMLDYSHTRSPEQIPIINLLLDNGANPDTPDSRGNTPLMRAAYNGEKEIVAALIAHKADLNATNDDGRTALHSAINNPTDAKLEVAKLLLDAGANPNIADLGGRTPLVYVSSIAAPPSPFGQRLLPGRPPGVVPGPGQNSQSDIGESAAALLREHGAVTDVPDFTTIRLSRRGGQNAVIFHQSTNDLNHFTLFEAIASYYENPGGFLSQQGTMLATVSPGGLFPFPDLPRLRIIRPVKGNLTERKELPVFVLTETNTFDCAKDMPLEFGDVIEIPEREHGLTESPQGFTREQSASLLACLAGRVTFKGRKGSVELETVSIGYGNFLSPVMKNPEVQALLTSASDLTRVKVTRVDPRTKKTREIVEDIQFFWNGHGRSSDDVWLRDGDAVEVPEK